MPALVLASAHDSPRSTSPQKALHNPDDNSAVHPVTGRIASAVNCASDMTVALYHPADNRGTAIRSLDPGNPVIQKVPDNREAHDLLHERKELYRMALDCMNSLIERMPRLVDMCVVMASFLVFGYGLMTLYAVNRGRIYADHEFSGNDIFPSVGSTEVKLLTDASNRKQQPTELKLITDASDQKPLSSDTRLATNNNPYRKHEECLAKNSPQLSGRQKNNKNLS